MSTPVDLSGDSNPVDLNLESALRERQVLRGHRAFRRCFWWAGVVVTAVWLLPLDLVLLFRGLGDVFDGINLDALFEFVAFLIVLHLGCAPVSYMIFGVVPGIVGWLWLQVFPESVLGDVHPFKSRDPMPGPPKETTTRVLEPKIVLNSVNVGDSGVHTME